MLGNELSSIVSRGLESGDVDIEGHDISSTKSCSSLAEALKEAGALHVFRACFRKCCLGSGGFEKLVRWLSFCTQLRHLDLSNNRLVTPQ